MHQSYGISRLLHKKNDILIINYTYIVSRGVNGSKNLNSYPTRSGHGSTWPDPYKIIKYVLIIFI
jgi:hypothetical protein